MPTSRLLPCLLAGCLNTPPLVPPTVDEDPSLPSVQVNGSLFHVVEEGQPDGVPLIFLAGGPGNDALYLSRLGEPCDGVDLGASMRLVFWDQRGTGLSRRHDDESLLTLDTFEADLDALVDHLDPEGLGVVLAGHSWGGMLAASYLNRHPERVLGAVLLEPGEYSSDIWDDWVAAGGTSTVEIDFGAEWLNDIAWSSQLLTMHDHDALDLSILIAARGVQPDRKNQEEAPTNRVGGAVIRSNFLGGFYPERFDFTTQLQDYPHEVLVVAGDTPTSDLGADFQRFQLDYLANPTLEVIDGAGHTDVVWADACTTVRLTHDYLQRQVVL